MSNELDLATVLLLQKTAYIVGIISFVYLYFTTSHLTELLYLSIGFVLMVIGSTLAGMGEWQQLPDLVWQLGSIATGICGYAFIWMGQKALSKRRSNPLDWLAMAPVTLIVAVALVTHFEMVNAYRAATFNLVAAVAFLASSGQFLLDYRREPLQSRFMLAGVNAIAGLLCLNAGVGFLYPDLFLFNPITIFFFFIVLNFALVLFISGMISERAHNKLRRQADTDHLTEISNRRSFFMRLTDNPGLNDTVILLDLDHFKKINDRFGHIAGDAVLQTIAQRVKQCLRPEDLLARYGGEEFIILLPKSGLQQAEIICERIRHKISAQPVCWGDDIIRVTASLGAAIADKDCSELQGLINAADKKLYEAKQQGRNRVEIEDFKTAA